ncbi:MAG: hypothetical protein KME26_21665 [Oscillatoria princeps RMCB-10]|nr:hypothetical protein [Oscillatoria princeps RMCB-10]
MSLTLAFNEEDVCNISVTWTVQIFLFLIQQSSLKMTELPTDICSKSEPLALAS